MPGTIIKTTGLSYRYSKANIVEQFPYDQWYSIFTSALILMLGFIDFRTRKIKS